MAQWAKQRVALHYTACSQGVSSNPLASFFFSSFFFFFTRQSNGGGGVAPLWVTMAFIPSEEIPKMMK